MFYNNEIIKLTWFFFKRLLLLLSFQIFQVLPSLHFNIYTVFFFIFELRLHNQYCHNPGLPPVMFMKPWKRQNPSMSCFSTMVNLSRPSLIQGSKPSESWHFWGYGVLIFHTLFKDNSLFQFYFPGLNSLFLIHT